MMIKKIRNLRLLFYNVKAAYCRSVCGKLANVIYLVPSFQGSTDWLPTRKKLADPMLVYCWYSVVDAGPTLNRDWVNASFPLGVTSCSIIKSVASVTTTVCKAPLSSKEREASRLQPRQFMAFEKQCLSLQSNHLSTILYPWMTRGYTPDRVCVYVYRLANM